MKRNLILPHNAETDLNTHFVYLAENAGLEIALRFDDLVLESFKRLLESPFIGPGRDIDAENSHQLRMWFVKDFTDYLIFYRVTDSAIEVVRILHSSQDAENILLTETEN